MTDLLVAEFKLISSVLNVAKLRNKVILVTGATGLIGSYLVYFLEYLNSAYHLGMKIYALSRDKKELENRFGKCLIVFPIVQDLNLPFQLDFYCDYIIHAASNASPVAYATDPVGTMKTNLFGTLNLLDFARVQNAKFLYLSSGEVYGSNIDHPFTEDEPGSIDSKQIRSCYPESKRAAETLCIAYHQQYGLHINIARLCYIFGPTITGSNSRADAQFLRDAVAERDIVLKSQGTQRRTWCYVADTVYALLIILLKAPSPEVYNIADENSIFSIRQYAETLANIAKVGVRFELPDKLEKQGYSSQADSILDGTKLKRLGWNPLFSIQVGLERTYQIKRILESCI